MGVWRLCKDRQNKKDIQQVFIEQISGSLPKLYIMIDFEETPEQAEIAAHSAYLIMKGLHYTNAKIAEHMSYTNQQLASLISRYTFVHAIEYKLQEKEGNCQFNGCFYISKGVQSAMMEEEILEIYSFVQDLVEQHNGIDNLQEFYSIEHDCKLLFIDHLDRSTIETNQFPNNHNHCTLMLFSEY